MTFSYFISDSLADQEVFLSTHITCLLFSSLLHFLDLSFPNKIVLFSPKLKKKKKNPIFSPSFHSLRSCCPQLLPGVSCSDSNFLSVQLTSQNLSVHLVIPSELQYYHIDLHLLKTQNQCPLLAIHACLLPLTQ